MTSRSLALAGAAPLFVACFAEPSPSSGDDSTGSDAAGDDVLTTAASSTATSGGPSPATTAVDGTGSGSDEAGSTGAGSEGTGSSGAGSEDTGPPSTCGNGMLDPGEDCDDGPANAPEASCTPECTVAACGDGFVGPGEACDDGARTGLMVPTCRFDCQGFAPTRQIVVSAGSTQGNFDGVMADAQCPGGHRALVAVPGARIGSVTPLLGDGQIDWVLQPHTAYVNAGGELVWLTDDVALLGVRDGALQPLLAPLGPSQGGILQPWTGLTPEWTLDDAHCSAWSTTNGQGRLGEFGETDDSAWSSGSADSCTEQNKFYCVEQ